MQGAQTIAMLQTQGMTQGQMQGSSEKIDPSMFGGIMNVLLGGSLSPIENMEMPEGMMDDIQAIKAMLLEAGIEIEDLEMDMDTENKMPILPQMIDIMKQQNIEIDALVRNIKDDLVDSSKLADASDNNIVIKTLSSEKVSMELLRKIEATLLSEKNIGEVSAKTDLKPTAGTKDGQAEREMLVDNIKNLLVDRNVAKKPEIAAKTVENASPPPIGASSNDDVMKGNVKQGEKNSDMLNVKKDESLSGEILFSSIRVNGERQVHQFRQVEQVQELPQKNVENIEANMIKFIETARDGDMSKMIVKLTPESLGELSLNLSVRDGKLTAKIFVENNQIREIIDGKLAELTGNLQKHNINIEKIQVHVAQQAESQPMDMGSHESFKGHQNRQQWQRQNERMSNLNRQYQETSPVRGEKSVSGISILA